MLNREAPSPTGDAFTDAPWFIAGEMVCAAERNREMRDDVVPVGLVHACAAATSPDRSPEERRQAAIILGALAIRIAAGDSVQGEVNG